MKTLYKKMKLLELLKLPALIILFLALGYTASAQTWYPSSNSPVCIPTPIDLSISNLPPGWIWWQHNYQWSNYSGTWWSTDYNPSILSTDVILVWPYTTAYLAGPYSLSIDGGVAQYTVVTFASTIIVGTAAANQTICYNSVPAPVTSVPASGGSGIFTYNWQVSPVGGPFTDISGATSPLIYTPTLPLTATTYYRLRVTDTHCSASAYSNVLEMWVQSIVTPGTIAANQTICNGSTPALLTSSLDGTGDGTITYKWEDSFNTGTTWNLISGATSFYQPGVLTTTTQYRRTTISTTGALVCTSVPTTPVTITVQGLITPGTIAADQTICNDNTPAPLTGTPATGSGTITYSWEANYGLGWTTILGSGIGYSPGALTSNTQYRRTATSTGGINTCNSVPTNVVTITVQSLLTAGTIAANQTICNGSIPAPLTSTLAGTGSGTITYSWEVNYNGLGWNTISGSGPGFSPGALIVNTQYRRTAISTIGTNACYSAPTTPVTITVQGLITPGTIAADQTICNGSTPAALTGTPATGSGTITYSWEANYGLGWTTISGSGIGYSPGALTSNTQYRRTATSTGGINVCNSVPTNVVTITVQSLLTAGTIAANQTICNGSIPAPLTSTLAGTGSGTITYSWEVNYNGLGWNPISGSGSGFSPGALTVNTQYRRTAISTIGTNACNSAPTTPVTITVQGLIEAGTIAANQTICNGSIPAPLTGTTVPGSGITYSWEVNYNGLGWNTISGQTGTGYAPGALTVTTQYRRTATSTLGGNACNSAPTTPVTITVQSLVTAGTIAANQTICNGSTPAPLTSTTPGTGSGTITYGWEVNYNGLGWNTIPGQTGTGYAPGALTSNTQYRRTTVSTIGGGAALGNACYSAPTTPVTITVLGVLTAGTIAANQTICANTIPALLTGVPPTGGTTPYTYQWLSSLDNSTFANISGATLLNYQPGALTTTTYYREVQTSGGACGSDTTNVVQIFVTDSPIAGVTGPDTLCQGSCGTYIATGGIDSDTYQWSVSGTYNSITYFGNTVTICWGACTEGWVQVTISRGNCSNTSAPFHVILHAPPSPIIVGPITVIHDTVNTVTYSALPGTPGHLFNWTVYNGTIIGGQGTDSIQVLWDSPCLGCTGQVCVYESDPAFDTCSHGAACMTVYILPNQANVFGYVSYENNYLTGLNNVNLTLRNAVDYSIVGQCTSAPNMLTNGQSGYFAFHSIPYGSYVLTAESDGTWGGNNATDALIVQMLTPGPLSTPVKTLAADVNGSLTINATDALNIKLRVVGIVNTYNAGDWAFVPATFTLSSGSPVKNFGTSFHGLCMGDVNGSYIPTSMKSVPSLTATEDGIQTVAVGESFTYDLRSNSIADLGAMTLFMNFDQNLFEIVNVKTSLEGLQYKIENGKLALAWSDVIPISVSNDYPVISLTVKAKEQISAPTQIFTISAGSEFANSNAEPLYFDLKMSNVLTGGKNFSMANYPNPFANTTNIVYTLPEAGQVRLVITDMYGRTLSVLVDAMEEAGNHSVVVNPANLNLSQGVYLYKIEVFGATDTYIKVNKLIFNK